MNNMVNVRGRNWQVGFPYDGSFHVSNMREVFSRVKRNVLALAALALSVSIAVPALGSEFAVTDDSFQRSDWSESGDVFLASNGWTDSVIQTLQDQNGDQSVGSADCIWDLDSDSSRFFKTPWLIYKGNPTAMHIYFETIPGVSDYDDYRQVHFEESGVSNGISSTKIDVDGGSDSRLFNTLVTGLTPGQSYTYTVKVRDVLHDEYNNPEDWDCFKGTFHAAQDDDTDILEFYGFGDQKYIDSNEHATLSADISKILGLLNSHPGRHNFVINTGDMVINGGNHRPFGTSYWDEYWWLQHNGYFLGSMPMFTAMGNHDFQVNQGDTNCMYYANCDESVITTDSGKSNPDKYYRYFPYWHAPGGDVKDAYYHFRYGPAHFWSINTWPTNNDDSNGYCGKSDNLNPESAQYKWFVSTIEALADDPTQQWKIVFTHNPPFSPGDCNQWNLQQYWVPLFEKYGVDLVLSGHEHYYSRKDVNGIPYMLLGGGGAQISDWHDTTGFISTLAHHHFAYFKIDHDMMAVGVHDIHGELTDNFSLDRTPRAGWWANQENHAPPTPYNVHFTDRSTGNIYQWEWDFGDGSTLSGSSEEVRNPTHGYDDYGQYKATLTVRSKNNISTHTGTVNVLPHVAFDASPTEGHLPLDVQFVDQSEGEVAEYLWYFGDSETSLERDPQHRYDTNGQYSVKLTVTTSNGTTSTGSISNLIKVEPYALFEANNIECSKNIVELYECTPLDIENKSEGDTLTYYWDFDDGLTSTERSPYHEYPIYDAQYNLRLTVTDKNLVTDSYVKPISVRLVN